MNTLSASIVTWNSEKSIGQCIDSVLTQTFSDFDVIVVDNDSQDDTCRIVSSYDESRIQLRSLKFNSGFCAGHNLVIRETNSKFVMLVNPDVVLDKYYFSNALHRMQSGYRIGTVCGLLIQSDLQESSCLIDSAGLSMFRDRRGVLRYHNRSPHSVDLHLAEVFGADGALPLYRRELINDVSIEGQFFDEFFFMHKEDWDVSWRAQLYGWTTVFDPSCVAIHPRVFKPGNISSRRNMVEHAKYHSVKNQLIMLIKNEDLSNFVKDFFLIVPRLVGIFVYVLLFERKSFKAYPDVLGGFRLIWGNRATIQSQRRISSKDIRKYFLVSEDGHYDAA